MTDVLIRPPPPRADLPVSAGRVVAIAATTAMAAAGTGLVAVAVVVLLAWATDGGSASSAGDALRTAGEVWLVAQHGGLALAHGELGLMPLGLVALPAALLVRAGAGLARSLQLGRPRAAVLPLLALAACYALLARVVAWLAATDAVVPSAAQALFGAFVLAVVAGGVGLLRGADLLPALTEGVPARVRTLVRVSTAALLALLGAGALLAAGALAWHAGRAAQLSASLDPGIVGGIALLLVCLAYAPVGAVWGTAYLVGPGFAVGAATVVSPFGVSLGAVPALPLLAALPVGGPPPTVLAALLALPVAAGGLAGWMSARQPSRSRGETTLWALACGPSVGLALALLCWLAAGPVGAGRLATVGPSPWQIGLVGAAEVGVGAAVGGWLAHRRAEDQFGR